MTEEEMKALRERVIAALDTSGKFGDTTGSTEPGEAHIIMAYDEEGKNDIQITIDLM